VRDALMAVELCVAHPRLGKQPVPLRIARQEDGAVRPWGLTELGLGKEGELVRTKTPTHKIASTAGGKRRKF
jgi:hypothetical protein